METPYNTNPRDCGGPENSLTLWGDQDYLSQSSILADYGNAWSFMLFLYDRYGLDFMSTLHRDGDDQGLAGLQDALDSTRRAPTTSDVHPRLPDGDAVDTTWARRRELSPGIAKSRVTSKSLNSTVNLDNPRSYAADGASANGADYVLACATPEADTSRAAT